MATLPDVPQPKYALGEQVFIKETNGVAGEVCGLKVTRWQDGTVAWEYAVFVSFWGRTDEFYPPEDLAACDTHMPCPCCDEPVAQDEGRTSEFAPGQRFCNRSCRDTWELEQIARQAA